MLPLMCKCSAWHMFRFMITFTMRFMMSKAWGWDTKMWDWTNLWSSHRYRTLHISIRPGGCDCNTLHPTWFCIVWLMCLQYSYEIYKDIRVIHKVTRLGVESSQFLHKRASNTELGIQNSTNQITGTQTSLFANFVGKLSFILSFLFPERFHCCYIHFHCSYLYNYYNYSQTLCIKCWVRTTERGDRGWKRGWLSQ